MEKIFARVGLIVVWKGHNDYGKGRIMSLGNNYAEVFFVKTQERRTVSISELFRRRQHQSRTKFNRRTNEN